MIVESVLAPEGGLMDDPGEFDFIVDSLDDERDYPIAQLTGWETIVFQLQEDDEPIVMT